MAILMDSFDLPLTRREGVNEVLLPQLRDCTAAESSAKVGCTRVCRLKEDSMMSKYENGTWLVS